MKEALKYTFAMIGIGLALWAMYTFRAIILYFVLASVLFIVLHPIKALYRRIHIGKVRLPSAVAAILTIFSFVFVIFVFFKLFAPLVTQQAKSLSQLDAEYTTAQLETKLSEITDELGIGDIVLSGDEGISNQEYLLDKLQEVVDVGRIGQTFKRVFGVIGNAVVGFLIILFMTFFLLKDSLILQRIIFSLTPDRHINKMKNIQRNSTRLLRRYFVGILIQMSIVTTMVTVGLIIIGVKNALIIGFLAAVLNLIPYIGPFMAGFLGLTIAFTTNLHLDFQTELIPLLFKVLLVFVAYQAVDITVNQPYILGGQVHAHPLEVFIVVSIAGVLGGPLAMIVAIPGYTLFRIVAREFLSQFKTIESLTRSIKLEREHGAK